MTPSRIAILSSAFLAYFLAVRWVQSGYEFEVQSPKKPLSALPMQIEGWSGEDSIVGEDTARVLNAHSHLNRLYQDPIGRRIFAHIAIWAERDEVMEAAPHPPDVCYPAAGWVVISRRHSNFEHNGVEVPIELILFQRGEEQVVVGHWYRMGDRFFTGVGLERSMLYELWGTKQWPYTTKFLLQCSSSSIKDAESLLLPFAGLLLEQAEALDESS